MVEKHGGIIIHDLPNADANADTNTKAGGSATALPELHLGELKMVEKHGGIIICIMAFTYYFSGTLNPRVLTMDV